MTFIMRGEVLLTSRAFMINVREEVDIMVLYKIVILKGEVLVVGMIVEAIEGLDKFNIREKVTGLILEETIFSVAGVEEAGVCLGRTAEGVTRIEGSLL